MRHLDRFRNLRGGGGGEIRSLNVSNYRADIVMSARELISKTGDQITPQSVFDLIRMVNLAAVFSNASTFQPNNSSALRLKRSPYGS